MSKMLIDRAALEQPEQEPVAIKDDDGLTLKAGWDDLPVGTSLYTTPPRREQEQEQPEPVARVIDDGTPEGSTEWIPYSVRQVPVKTGDLLYTHPPRREWQGLTEEQVKEVVHNTVEKVTVSESILFRAVARAIEAALKERNHG